MEAHGQIPTFSLFGETKQFPDLVHCERFSARAPITDWRITAHRHAQMVQLFVIHDGFVQALVDGQAIALEDRCFLFVPAQTVHQFDFKPGTEGVVISIVQNLVGMVAPHTTELALALSAPLSGTLHQPLRAQTDLLAQLSIMPTRFRTQKLVGIAHSVLATVAECANRTGLNAHASAKFEALNLMIAEHLSDGWGASDYASALSVSTGHLSRICRDVVGIGATAFIAQKMNQEACRMLVFTQLTVSEIGYRLAYSDPSYFSKRFKAVQGVTPSEYRAQFRS